MNESSQMRKNVEKVYLELCDECSLPESANMAQCLRIITLRFATCPTVIGFKIEPSELDVSDRRKNFHSKILY